ncbi:hypothetical protein EVAR_24823_1 [Eumeta japonica]|uniref:Uncharacterized protein n=1 Tax=Eumeta variegata TaxID=151549 RepID=A0A4C1W0T4_EUMVA|nr:hypothetical protein EVAR_24823_1 [Eumeta japonica]
MTDGEAAEIASGGARRRRRRRPPTALRLKGPRKQKSFAYKLLKRGLANLMSPTSTNGVAPPLEIAHVDDEGRICPVCVECQCWEW